MWDHSGSYLIAVRILIGRSCAINTWAHQVYAYMLSAPHTPTGRSVLS